MQFGSRLRRSSRPHSHQQARNSSRRKRWALSNSTLHLLEDRRLLAFSDFLYEFPDPSSAVSGSGQHGFQVAQDAQYTAVAAPRAVVNGIETGRVSVFLTSTGGLITTIENPNPDALDFFGSSIGVSNGFVVVGARFDDMNGPNAGAAYIFNASNGQLLHTLPAPASLGADDQFGETVAIGNGKVAVSSLRRDVNGAVNTGSVFIYDALSGSLIRTIDNPALVESPATASNNLFGYSLSLDANTLVVGTSVNKAYVYNLATTNAPLRIDNPTPASGGTGFGQAVSVSGGRIAIGAPSEDTTALDAGAVYLYNTSGTMLQRFVNPAPSPGDLFGLFVAISGDTLAVSAPFDDVGATDSGSVYIYNAATFQSTFTFNNPNPATNDQMGSLATSGASIIVGAPLDDAGSTDSGNAYRLKQSSTGVWTWNNTLAYPFRQSTPTSTGDEFGTAVAANEAFYVVGAYLEDEGATPDAGAVYVYSVQTGALIRRLANPTPQASDQFGSSVSVYNNRVVVGAFAKDVQVDGNTLPNAGSAYLFDLSTGGLVTTWTSPSPEANGQFGRSVDIDSDNVIISEWLRDEGATNSGKAYLFHAGIGQLITSFNNPAPGFGDGFGFDVAISGLYAVIAASSDDATGTDSGTIYVMRVSDGSLVRAINNPFPNPEDDFGFDVDIAFERVIAGARKDDTQGVDAGAAYLFNATTGDLLASLYSPTPSANDQFGSSVAITGRTIVVGSPRDNTGAADAGSAFAYYRDGSFRTRIANPSPSTSELFGTSVAATDLNLVVGAPYVSTTAARRGATYAFDGLNLTANPGGPYSVDEGSILELNAANSETSAWPITSYDWDFNYDGITFDIDGTGVTTSFQPTGDDLTRTIALRLTDAHGHTRLATTQVLVNNVAPTLNAILIPDSIAPGTPFAIEVDAEDPAGTNDPFTYEFDFDNNGTYEVTSSSPIVNYAYATPGNFIANVRVDDGDGGIAAQTISIPVGTSVSLTAASASLNENSDNIAIEAVLERAMPLDVSISLRRVGGANAGDYRLSSNTIVIPAGSTRGFVDLIVNDDRMDEATESFSIVMDPPTAARLGAQTTFSFEILDNDLPPTISFKTAQQDVTESTANVTLTAVLSAASSFDVTVPITFSGTASSPADYTQPTSSFFFPAGTTSSTTTLTVVDDTIAERTETVVVKFGIPTNATISTAVDRPTAHTVRIADNEPTRRISFTSTGFMVSESNNTVDIAVRMDGASSETIQVPVSVRSSSTASLGTDFEIVSPNSSVYFAPGQTESVFTIRLLDDSLFEGNLPESLSLTLQTPISTTGATVGGTRDFVLSISDSERMPFVRFSAPQDSISEDGGVITVRATLSTQSATDITLDLEFTGSAMTNPSTATVPGTDYRVRVGQFAGGRVQMVNSTYQLVMNAGSSFTDFEIEILDDQIAEPFESIDISASKLSGATYELVTRSVIAGYDRRPFSNTRTPYYATSTAYERPSESITIENDDTVEIAFQETSLSIGESTNTAQGSLIVNLSQPINKAVRIPFTAYNQLAKFGSDFDFLSSPGYVRSAAGGYLTVPASTATKLNTSGEIKLRTLQDDIDEPEESFVVVLEPNSSSNAIPKPPISPTRRFTQSNVFITDDDTVPTVHFAKGTTNLKVNNTQEVKEGAGSIKVVAALSHPSDTDLTWSLPSNDAKESARRGKDYKIDEPRITIKAGQITGTTTIKILDDKLVEGDETITLTLSPITRDGRTFAKVDKSNSLVFTVKDNDKAPAKSNVAPSIPDLLPGQLAIQVGQPMSAKELDELNKALSSESTNSSSTGAMAQGALIINRVASEGYISGGAVFLDANFDGTRGFLDRNNDGEQGDDEPEEPYTLTGARGEFVLDVPSAFDLDADGRISVEEGRLTLVGGLDTSTQLPIRVPMLGPSDWSAISPLTTLITLLAEEEEITPDDAAQRVLIALNLPVMDISRYDAIASTMVGDGNGPLIFSAGVKLYNVVMQGASLLSGTVDAPPIDDVGMLIFQELAKKLNEPNASLDISNPAIVRAVMSDVVATSGVVLPNEDATLDGVASVIAASNQAIDAIEPTMNLDYLTSVVKIQVVAQGYLADRFVEVGGDHISIDAVVAEGTGAALQSRVVSAQIGNIIPPEVSISSMSLVEGDGTEEVWYEFHVSLNAPSAVPISFDYRTNDYTATEGLDYEATSGTLSWQPGDATDRVIRVKGLGDSLAESVETFMVVLDRSMNASFFNNVGFGILVDDDPVSVYVPSGNAMNDLVLRLEGNDTVLVNNEVEIYRQSGSLAVPLHIVGANDASNRFVIDLTYGNPVPTQGIDFVGGDQNDQLSVLAAVGHSFTKTTCGLGQGEIGLDGLHVRYEHVEDVIQHPTITATSPLVVNEGDVVQLNISVDAFGNQSIETFDYKWDLDGDGIFGEIDSDASRGDERGFAPTFSAQDLEGPATYEVVVRAIDSYGLIGEAILTVDVLNVNQAPTAIALTGQTIAENNLSGALIGTFSSTDPDSGDTFTYSLVSGNGDADNGAFSIEDNELRAAATFDFEAKSIYSIRVRTTDANGLAFEQAFTIQVTNVNEAPTTLTLSNNAIAENNLTGAVVGTFSSTDPDAAETFTYSLVSGNGDANNSVFTIEGNELKAAESFDFEAKNSYSIRVRTTDANGLAFEQAFTILMTNVNEAPATLTLSSNAIAENNLAGAVIGTFSSTDPDAADTFTYSFVSGDGDADNGAFSIEGNELKAAESFDFESKNSYSIRVRTTDANGLMFEQAFTIEVTNVNEAPTTLTLSNNAIAENNLAGAVIGTFSSTDPDAGETFTYSLVSGNGDVDNSVFTIEGNELKAAESFDFEIKNSYSIRVRTTDANGLAFEQAFTIEVTDVNEAPTTLTLSNNAIAENNLTGAVIGTFSSTDPDSGETFTYSLVSGNGDADNGGFSIAGNELKAAESFDFEIKNSYSIRVRTTDANGLAFEQAFTIEVTNVNEAPTTLTLSSNAIAENNLTGAVIGTFSSTDPDSGETFTYSLVSGNGDADNGGFSIEGNELKAAESFDFEAKNSYSIRVRTTDANGLMFEQAFTIQVTSVNEAPTTLTLSNNAIAENNLAGAVIGTFSSTDPDSGETFTYSLVSGNGDVDNSVFTIEGNELKAAESFDFEIKNSYSIRVRTTDANGLAFEQAFTIEVTNVNEAPTTLTLSINAIAENNLTGAVIGTFSPTDPDSGETFTYSFVSGNGDANNSVFTIEGNELKAAESFDFEAKNSYSIRVRTTDANGLVFEQAFTIEVTNVNETPTTLTLSNNAIAENNLAGAAIGTFSSTDPDAADTFTYSLVSGNRDADNSVFSIEGNELKAAESFDFEAKNGYSIRVRTTDANGLAFEQAFTIEVINVNEAPTTLTLSNNAIAENNLAGAVIGTFSSTDPDAAETFTYSFVSGNGDVDNNAFSIEGNELKTAESFDFEAKSSYSIRVRTTDANGLMFEQAFTIEVTNVNEAPTTLTLSNNAIAENNLAGAVIGTFSSTDPDAAETFTYSLISGNGDADNGGFSIEGNELKAAESFDFEAKNSYSIRVRTTDANGLAFEQAFAIQVTNVNEAPTIAINRLSIAEGASVVLTVADLNATDPDNAPPQFAYSVSGVARGRFEYVTTPGVGITSFTQSQVAAAAVRFVHDGGEVAPSYSLSVTDGNLSSSTSSASITFSNVNDAPVVVTRVPDVNVNPGAPPQVINLTNFFADVDHPTLHYSATTSDASIVSPVITSSILSLTFSAIQTGTATVIVTATDGGNLSVTSQFVVTIQPISSPPGVVLSNGVLRITGTNSNDELEVERVLDNIVVITNFTSPSRRTFAANTVQSLDIRLFDGNDEVELASSITIPSTIDGGRGNDEIAGGSATNTIWGGPGNDEIVGGSSADIIYGGDGNDEIEAGAGHDFVFGDAGNDELEGEGGNDLLVGGLGNDEIEGGSGRDVLLGGSGSDELDGENDDDLLIGHRVLFESNLVALAQVMSEWGSSRSYASRIANLRGTGTGPRDNGTTFLNTSTLVDDQSADSLFGGSGQDWYLAPSNQDDLEDRRSNEALN